MRPLAHLILASLSAYVSLWVGCWIFSWVDFPAWTILPCSVTCVGSICLHVTNIWWAAERVQKAKP